MRYRLWLDGEDYGTAGEKAADLWLEAGKSKPGYHTIEQVDDDAPEFLPRPSANRPVQRRLLLCSMVLFGLAVWLAWPMLTLKNYPHLKMRDNIGIVVMILAWAFGRAYHRMKCGRGTR
jgi:hypothetical protein